jgi:LPS-assembly lipoprotein
MKFTVILLYALAVLALAGCSYRPLYGTSVDGRGVADTLSGIAIDAPSTRIAQQIRNNLLSAIRPAGTASPDIYRLTLTPDAASVVVADQGRPGIQRRRLRLNVTYQLYDIASGSIVSSGKTFSVVSYDTIHEPVADLQAEANAGTRAAQDVAGDIRTRLAAFVAKQQG